MRKLTQQEVENYYKENGYELLSIYENYNTPLTMKCPKGHISNSIEFDGKQHFIPVKYFGGEEGFKERKRRDELKNKYCKENDIKLIRIPYNSFKDIKSILLKNLNL